MAAFWTDKMPLKFFLFLAVLVFCLVFNPGSARAENQATTVVDNQDGKVVYIVNVKENFTNTMVNYIKRSLNAAEIDQADYFLLDLNAYANCDEFAKKISDLLLSSPLHTVCYINDRAFDGAALVALSCDTIIMSPGADFGSNQQYKAEDGTGSDNADYWLAVFNNAAKLTGHNLAAAQSVVKNQGIFAAEEPKGQSLEISTNTALKIGLADAEATSLQVVLKDYQLEDGVIIQVEKNFYERCVDSLSSPFMATLMLAIGLGALIIEFLFSGYGVAGFTGALCLFLYFFGGYQSGTTSGYMIFLLTCSFVLLMLELFLSPGSGVCGVCGVIGLFVSIMLVAPTMAIAWVQIIIVIMVVVILIMASKKNGNSRNIFRGLILREQTTTEEGYLSQPLNIHDYLGKEGVALTALRPAGAVKIGTERVDVVTEGDFIAAGDRVIVIKVDGSSVIVRKE